MSVGTWIQITLPHMRSFLCQTNNLPEKKCVKKHCRENWKTYFYSTTFSVSLEVCRNK